VQTIQSLQPQQAGAAGGMTREERVMEMLDDIVDKLREEFNMLGVFVFRLGAAWV
jgi:hypothetical protein